MINKKISNPLKATTLGLFVYYAFRLHNSKVDAYAKGTELLSNFPVSYTHLTLPTIYSV